MFPPGALASMFYAAAFALVLQFGVTVAATVVDIFTPPIGLSCHSLAYIIYGGTAVLILFFTIISTLFARISETRTEQSTLTKNLTASVAIFLRRFSLLLAFINATGLIVISCLQFSNFLSNCYCKASVLGRGADSYVVIILEGWVTTMRNARLVAIGLATGSTAVFMVFLWLTSALPSDIDDF